MNHFCFDAYSALLEGRRRKEEKRVRDRGVGKEYDVTAISKKKKKASNKRNYCS